MIDGFFIYHLTKELNNELSKSRLEKIVQQTTQSFILTFYHQKERKNLAIDLSPDHFRIHITNQRTKDSISSQFLATLKKQLEGSILDRIEQHETDRVIKLIFTTYDFIDGPVSKTLIFEAMGKHSNLILIKDSTIIDTYKKMFFETGRQLLPQASFEYFPSHKKNASHIDYPSINHPKDLSDAYMGISLMLAKYLFEHQIQLNEIPLNPTQNLSKNKFYAFDIFDSTDHKKYYKTLSILLDQDIKEEKPKYTSQSLFIEKQLKKLSGKKLQLESALDEAYEQLKFKEIGEIIYQSGIDVNQQYSKLDVSNQTIILDASKTLNENAQEYFKKYQKAKRSIIHIDKQIEQTKSLIEHFESLKIFMSMSTQDSIRDLDKELLSYGYKKMKFDVVKKKKDKPNLLTLRDGEITYTIGKNNLQNELLTHTLADKNDYWFHVKDAPGAHVVVHTSDLNESVLRKACMLAAYYSGMKHSSSIPVDYTRIKYIKKIPGLPGYKVTYKNQQTMYIDIDEEKINDYLKNV